MALTLGIDIGTSSAKAVLADEAGNILAEAIADYPLSTPRPLWSEQDPEHWWQGACACFKQIVDGYGSDGASEIKAVGLSGQMHGLVLLDAAGNVLRPAILWNDQRTGDQCAAITEKIGFDELIKRTGNPVLPGFTAPKILWVRENEPDVYAKVAHFLLPKDYVRYRMTGEFATEVSDAAGTSLLDVTKRDWSEAMFNDLDIPMDWAAKVYESPEVTGTVTSEGAQATGLPVGTPVVGGAGDCAAGAIGTGLTRQGLVSCIIGTSGIVFAPTDDPLIEPQGRLHAFCHAVPGMNHVMGVMLSAGGSLAWYRDTLGHYEIDIARQQKCDPYEILTEAASQAPIGCEGLLFMPYLTGERTPYADPNARGAYIGLTRRHERPHMIRATIEGITYGLRDSLELTRSVGINPDQIRVTGGGANSPFWRQMLADVFRCEVVTAASSGGGALGVALLASVGAGIHPDIATACDIAIKTGETSAPNEKAADRYDDNYAIYRDLYATLKPTFDKQAALND